MSRRATSTVRNNRRAKWRKAVFGIADEDVFTPAITLVSTERDGYIPTTGVLRSLADQHGSSPDELLQRRDIRNLPSAPTVSNENSRAHNGIERLSLRNIRVFQSLIARFSRWVGLTLVRF